MERLLGVGRQQLGVGRELKTALRPAVVATAAEHADVAAQVLQLQTRHATNATRLKSSSHHRTELNWPVRLNGTELYVGPVNTGMGDRLRRANHLSISPSQLSLLPSAGREMLRNNLGQVVYTYVPLSPSSITWYQPKCGDALRLCSKGRHGSFHLWIKVWVAGKTV